MEVFLCQQKNINIGEGELEIMKVIWKAGEPVASLFEEKALSDSDIEELKSIFTEESKPLIE